MNVDIKDSSLTNYSVYINGTLRSKGMTNSSITSTASIPINNSVTDYNITLLDIDASENWHKLQFDLGMKKTQISTTVTISNQISTANASDFTLETFSLAVIAIITKKKRSKR